MSTLLSNPIVAVASPEDATATAKAISPYLSEIDDITLVHVVEKGGGGLDKASVEQREDHAAESFDAFRSALSAPADEPAIASEIGYATDVADGILEAGRSHDATAIVFTSRGGGWFLDVLAGDVSDDLLRDSEFPVLALPNPEVGAGS